MIISLVSKAASVIIQNEGQIKTEREMYHQLLSFKINLALFPTSFLFRFRAQY